MQLHCHCNSRFGDHVVKISTVITEAQCWEWESLLCAGSAGPERLFVNGKSGELRNRTEISQTWIQRDSEPISTGIRCRTKLCHAQKDTVSCTSPLRN
ncbi:unnamed protein product [Caretta caretta]